MKGVFWNSRGLGDPAKHRFIAELVREQHLDFVAILETVKKDFSNSHLKHLSGGMDFFWHWLPPLGRSGGILLGVNMAVFEVGSIF